jgi:hypothetical protein
MHPSEKIDSGKIRKVQIVLASLLLAALAALYTVGPVIIAAVWHLKHGDRLNQGGTSINVPDRWFSLRLKEGNGIFTVRPSWSREIFEFESITFAPLPSGDAEEQFELWEARASNPEFAQIHKIQKIETLQVGGRRVSCHERANPTLATSFSASCMIEGQMIVSFYGKQSDITEFYKTLASMTF